MVWINRTALLHQAVEFKSTHGHFSIRVPRYFSIRVPRYFSIRVARYFSIRVARYGEPVGEKGGKVMGWYRGPNPALWTNSPEMLKVLAHPPSSILSLPDPPS